MKLPTRILALPLMVVAAILLYLALEVDNRYAIGIVPCVMGLAALYVLSPQIEWWWYHRNPPDLDVPLRQRLTQHSAFYNNLTASRRERMRQRIALFMMGNDFTPMGMEEVPEDLRFVIACNAVMPALGQSDILYPGFEKIIVYHNPFPSPQYPDKLHASELFVEDGVVMLAAAHVMRSFLQPETYFNVALYEFVRVYGLVYGREGLPVVDEEDWSWLERVGFPREFVEKSLGLPDPDPLAVAVGWFFLFPGRFRVVNPDVYGQLETVFGGR